VETAILPIQGFASHPVRLILIARIFHIGDSKYYHPILMVLMEMITMGLDVRARTYQDVIILLRKELVYGNEVYRNYQS
jgi:hypothetical protein